MRRYSNEWFKINFVVSTKMLAQTTLNVKSMHIDIGITLVTEQTLHIMTTKDRNAPFNVFHLGTLWIRRQTYNNEMQDYEMLELYIPGGHLTSWLHPQRSE